MPSTPGNALNITSAGIVNFDGTVTFSADTVTQHDVLVGGASNAITSVAPTSTSGIPLVSNGASSDPSFTTAVVAGGGTGAVTLTNHGVLIGQATSAIVATAAGSAGQVLQSGGASADPVYSTATYPAATVGTGKILYDNGTNFVASTPTFPASASATSRKIIVSDGTNWVASTETWAVPGSSGNVLTSNGTNWTSAAPSGGILNVSGNLNSAQIKALKATPINVIATPGSGKMIQVIDVVVKFNYGGTNVFVAGSGQTIQLFYNTSSSIIYGLVTNNMIVGSSTVYAVTGGTKPAIAVAGVAGTNVENQPLTFINNGSAEITGNAGGDNNIYYSINYRIVTPT